MDVPNQYESVKKRVGWRDLSDRGKVRMTGRDHITFLHSMISNEVQALSEGEGNYGTFLTATGKILADFYYYRFSDFVLIDIARELLSGFVTRIQKYIIMDDVEVQDISEELSHFAVEGPRSLELLKTIVNGMPPSSVNSLSQSIWKGRQLWWIRKDQLVEPGYEMILPSSIGTDFLAELGKAGLGYGLEKIGPEAYDLLRLERGIPINGIDFTEKNNPVEARLENAYSLSKGCYSGQEVVSKATHVGSVPKALSRLKIEGQQIPMVGASVLDQKGKVIGRVTSAAFSPALRCSIALAFLGRGFWTPGEVCQIELASREWLRAVVVESFL